MPYGKVGIFVRKFEAYVKVNTPKGKPKNKVLVESIAAVRLSSLKSFWTDAGGFPEGNNTPRWWEIWLRDATNPHDVAETFRECAEAAGVHVSSTELKFPERRVLLAHGTADQLVAIANLFDVLAELPGKDLGRRLRRAARKGTGDFD